MRLGLVSRITFLLSVLLCVGISKLIMQARRTVAGHAALDAASGGGERHPWREAG
jgi:hypothetical protein